MRSLNSLPAADQVRVERWTRVIVTTYHNRHVGITPGLAMLLARRLSLKQAMPPTGDPWELAQQQLHDSLALKANDAPMAKPQLQYSPLLSSRPVHAAVRVALPMVAEACRRVGFSCLFCQDDQATEVSATAYQEYDRLLGEALRILARETGAGEKFDLFWREQAATLTTLTRRTIHQARQRRASAARPLPAHSGVWADRLPEADAMALGYMLRLEPELPIEARDRPNNLRVRPPPREPVLSRRKEGGVEGIRLTRREEDFDSMLLSELINPPPILADRLLNTGYLAVQREPKHEPRRDLLLAGIMPASVRAHLSGDFAKACWYHFLVELGYRLWLRGLHRSDFIWLDGDTLDRVRPSYFTLEDLPAVARSAAAISAESFQHLFLTSLGWLPDFVNGRGQFEETDPLVPLGLDEQLDSRPLSWCGGAWRRALRAPARVASLNVYTTVHVMAFLPTTSDASPAGKSAIANDLGVMHHTLGLGDKAGRAVSLTRVPKGILVQGQTGDTGWRYEAREHASQPDADPVSENRLAGWLLAGWLSQIEKEMGHG